VAAPSQVAALPAVRQGAAQRRFATRTPGAVIGGRDIGTVIAPDATAKLFIDARRIAIAAGLSFGLWDSIARADVLAELSIRDAANRTA
jgi:cytidylate kinase